MGTELDFGALSRNPFFLKVLGERSCGCSVHFEFGACLALCLAR